MTATDAQRGRTRLQAWWLDGVYAGALLAVIEGVIAGRRVPRGGLAEVALATVIGLGPGLLCWALLALGLAPLLAFASRRLLRPSTDAEPPWPGPLGLAALVASVLAALASGAMTQRAEAITDRPFAVGMIALGAGAGAALGALLPGLLNLLRDGMRTHPRTRSLAAVSGVLCSSFACCAMGGYLAYFDAQLAAMRVWLWFGMWAALCVFVMQLGNLLPVLRQRASAPMVQRALSRTALVLLPLSMLGTGVGLHAKPAAAAPLMAGGGPSAGSVLVLRALSDFDHDGAGAWLGSRDCAPFDAKRHPLAVDVPGNGVDEDCDGGDARKSKTPLTAAASRFTPVPAALVDKHNVLVICIDALRADHVGFGGGTRRPLTPYLDRLARKSWVFKQALATSSTTRQSVPSLFSGRWVSGLRWAPGIPVAQLDRANVMLPELLKAGGYRTMAVVDAWLPKFLPSFSQGFDSFEVAYGAGKWTEHGQQAAPYTNALAMQRMFKRDAKKPYLLYLHYEGPHYPYVPHPEVANYGAKPADVYDAEVSYVDRSIGQLLEMFDARGWLDDTVIVIFGDHGEEFLEHGGTQHSRTLYTESVRVPLLVHVPGQMPKSIDERVSLIDVMPTLLDVLGMPAPEVKPQGRSLLYPALGAAPVPERPFLSELLVIEGGKHEELHSLLVGRHKLIWNMTTGAQLLYDVTSDPHERTPLDDAVLLQQMSRRLRQELAASRP